MFIHACYCNNVSSLHLRDIMPYSISSWHHHRILAPSPHGGGSISKVISLDDDEELIHKVLTIVLMEYVLSSFVLCLFDFEIIQHVIF